MSMILGPQLPDATQIAKRYPLGPEHHVAERREEIQRILDGRDNRLMIVVGPCSAWPFDAVRTYAERLARLQEEVQERLLLVLRCYIQKPRTTIGWPGPLNQPHPNQAIDIAEGIGQCSALMRDVGKHAPLADEMLFTHNADYFVDRLSYIALGARSAEDMEHRYIASGLDVPVGVKNNTSGDIEVGVNGVLCVQSPHQFAHHQRQVETTGNPYAHLILRGGGGRPNYDPQSIATANHLMSSKQVRNPAIVIDASHDNSHNGHGKDPELQIVVVQSIMSGIRMQREEYRTVKGIMIESFILQGKQSDKGPDYHMGGLSITDPCLGWEKTETLLRKTAESSA